MNALLSLAKTIDAPGSIPFLLICIALGIAFRFLWPGHRRIAHAWLTLVLVGYLGLGLPLVATSISDGLPPVRKTSGLGVLDTLVIFDGDNRRGRVREATAAYVAGRPAEVWVLGDIWVVEALGDAGIAPDAIRQDAATPTTRHQIGWVRSFRDAHPTHRIAIVASRVQAPRVEALLESAGLDVVLLPSPIDIEPPTSGARLFVPMYSALRVSRDALYEHVALAYYRHQGWIR
jgi:hypothetical protein